MVERICPDCRHANPLDDRYCGFCGAALRQDALATRPSPYLPILGTIPREQLQQVGTALALGAAALAAEVGMAWLKRRNAVPALLTRALPSAQGERTTSVVSQRIVEFWERGELVRQVVEKQIWRRDEQ